jgi:hypothetical protein
MLRESLCRRSQVSERLLTNKTSIQLVGKILEGYAQKAVFRGFSHAGVRAGVATFRFQWHKNQMFDLVFDPKKRSLRFPVILPKVPRPMYDDLKRYIAGRQSEGVIEHRRVDPKKVRLSCAYRSGKVGLLAVSRDGDLEYATRKLINLVHEIFHDFLGDGLYYEYVIETFEIDPDQIGG